MIVTVMSNKVINVVKKQLWIGWEQSELKKYKNNLFKYLIVTQLK